MSNGAPRANTPTRQPVFGIGLSRTGTTSLTSALAILGYASRHFPDDPETQAEVRRVIVDCPHARPVQLPVLASVDALTDTPVCCIYQPLAESYPEAVFVLTQRDLGAWLASCRRYWAYVASPYFRRFPDADLTRYASLINRWLYGSATFDERMFAHAHAEYHARVEAFFAARPGRLLRLDICAGEGWAALCRFLSLPAPREPFPHENRW
jgi:hypothetical protein